MIRIHIGFDSSLIEEGVTADNARVFVEVQNCDVQITSAWGDAWAGFKVVREFETRHEAEVLAWDIARNPVSEFDRMGYDHAGWFEPAN